MSHMAREAAEAPEAVARFLDRNAAALADLGRRLRDAPPPVVLTSARGSSDNAAGYFKYLTGNPAGRSLCLHRRLGGLGLWRRAEGEGRRLPDHLAIGQEPGHRGAARGRTAGGCAYGGVGQ